jgi:hypothetical protein
MGFSRHRLSNPNPPCPAQPDHGRIWGKEHSGLISYPLTPVAHPQAAILISQFTTFPLAGREHPSLLGSSGAASSHQEVVAQV